MRHSVAQALGLALAVATLAACASPVEETIETPISRTDPSDAGTLGATATDATPPSSSGATTATTADSSTVASQPSASTPSPTVVTPTTRGPTAPPRPAAPPTTEPAPIGDGPVLTVPEGDGIAESPAFGDGPRPAFFALTATTTISCAQADPGTATLTWEVVGAETVDIGIGDSRTILNAGQPPAGTLDVPLDCAGASKYFVIAANPEGETIRSVSVSPG